MDTTTRQSYAKCVKLVLFANYDNVFSNFHLYMILMETFASAFCLNFRHLTLMFQFDFFQQVFHFFRPSSFLTAADSIRASAIVGGFVALRLLVCFPRP